MVSTANEFDADRPIERREQDRLSRRPFSEAIAKQILAVPIEHGFTVAVVGEWGSGKTSVVNMVAEALQAEDEPTTVLRFNPWLFGGSADLLTRFFGELSAQLGETQNEQLKEVVQALTEVGQALSSLSPYPGTGLLVGFLSKFVDRWARPPSLIEERERLRKALTGSRSRIVVLIDDLDRLEPSETREIMRLVRLTSDLPNLVFVLAFDNRRVAKSLDSDPEEGQRYLDKIVQVSYAVPAMRDDVLESVFLTWLQELVAGHDVTQLDRDVWLRVLYDVIKPLLSNLRDAKRYLYSLPVTLNAVGQEVALADLLGLEALRVLRPKLFEELRVHAHCLVHVDSPSRVWMLGANRDERIQEELSAMLDRIGDDRELMESVLETLFPTTQRLLGGVSFSTDSEGRWRRERRVASGEVFRTYLASGIEDDGVSARQVLEVFSALSEADRLANLFSSMDEQRLEAVIERLEDFQSEYPREAVSVAVPVLVSQMTRISDQPTESLFFSPRVKVTRVVLRLLRRIEDPAALAGCIEEMLDHVDSLSGWLCLVEMVGYRENIGHKLVGDAEARGLEQQLVHRILDCTPEQLAEEWNLAALCCRPLAWLEGDDNEQFANSLQEHLAHDDFVITVLRTAVVYRFTDGNPERDLFWDWLTEAFGEGLVDAVRRVAASEAYQSAGAEDRDTVALALKYAEGWRPKTLRDRALDRVTQSS